MKQAVILLALAAMAGCNNAADNKANTPTADTAKVAAKPPATDSAAAAKMMMEAMTPGPMHKILASMAGKWSGVDTFWAENGSVGETGPASHENKMILGGRYLQTTQSCKYSGMPYEGVSMLAYDNVRKMFIVSAMDNMGTGILAMEGGYDSATRTISIKGEYDEPLKGKTELRETYTITDDTHYEIVVYGTAPGGKEKKFVTVSLAKIKE